MKNFYLRAILPLLFFSYISYAHAVALLNDNSAKDLILRLQTVLNQKDDKTRDNFFKYYADSSARFIIQNHLLDPQDNSKELGTETLSMNSLEYSKYIDVITKPNYKHIFKIETNEVTIDSKTQTGTMSISIQEFGLRKQFKPGTNFPIHDMTILAATNCNLNIADNSNEVVITSMNCVGKIIQNPNPTPYTSKSTQ